MNTYIITEITEWEEDSHMMDGDASHIGWRAVQKLLEEERVRKIDEGIAVGLPFRCEADSIEEALECYNDTHCEYEYLQATECEYEEEGVTP